MMSSKKPNYEKPTTVIGKDATLETSVLRSKSSVQINGVLIGNVEVDASLVVGQGGKLVGNINASFLLVAGTIDGNILAKEQIHVMKTAVINGDILCGSIIIDEGAVINGLCKTQPAQVANSKNILNKLAAPLEN